MTCISISSRDMRPRGAVRKCETDLFRQPVAIKPRYIKMVTNEATEALVDDAARFVAGYLTG
jgi:hypothetical protein